MAINTRHGAIAVRSALALSLFIALVVPADAAAMHRSKVPARARTQDQVLGRPSQGAVSAGFAVPGWSDEQTRRWMDYNNACSSIHCP